MNNHLPIPELFIGDIGRFWTNTDFKQFDDNCILWNNKKKKPIFSIKNVKYLATRIAYKIHTGEDPQDKVVCQSCNNDYCVNGKHLYLSTQKEATQKYYEEGGQPSYGNQRLSESDLEEIKNLYKQGTSITIIIEKFKITKQHFYRLIK